MILIYSQEILELEESIRYPSLVDSNGTAPPTHAHTVTLCYFSSNAVGYHFDMDLVEQLS